jgi:hypothetical protein
MPLTNAPIPPAAGVPEDAPGTGSTDIEIDGEVEEPHDEVDAVLVDDADVVLVDDTDVVPVDDTDVVLVDDTDVVLVDDADEDEAVAVAVAVAVAPVRPPVRPASRLQPGRPPSAKEEPPPPFAVGERVRLIQNTRPRTGTPIGIYPVGSLARVETVLSQTAIVRFEMAPETKEVVAFTCLETAEPGGGVAQSVPGPA